jgi:hypothetical protein
MVIIDNLIQGNRQPILGHEPEEYGGQVGDILTIGSSSLRLRPELAVNIAYVISTWAELEAYLWASFAELMGSDAHTAMAIISNIESDGGKRAALAAIARSKLPEDEAEAMMRFVKTIEKRAKRRHNVAHGVWAVDSGINDGIILVNQRRHLPHSAEKASIREEIMQLNLSSAVSRSKANRDDLNRARQREADLGQIDYADWRIYRQRDFDKISIIIDHLKVDLFEIVSTIFHRKISERIARLETELRTDP